MTRVCLQQRAGPSLMAGAKRARGSTKGARRCAAHRSTSFMLMRENNDEAAMPAELRREQHRLDLSDFLAQDPRIVLGSSSSGRKAVFQELGLDFEVLHPDIDEKAIRMEEPEHLVMALAHAKAAALRERLGPVNEPLFLITADQVVVYEDTIREKPTSEAEARAFINSYSTASAKRVGAIVVHNLGTGKMCQALDIAEVFFQDIPEDVIDALIEVIPVAGNLELIDS